MTVAVGRWRATYTPGRWMVLSGPTSVVVLEPVTPQWSSLVSALWDEVVASSSITDLAAQLALYRIDTMPSFAAFFWTEEGMRSLVRGAVRVVDLASGSLVADGEGIQTWTEVGLGGVTQVRVDLPADAADESVDVELPLVVGAVRAATLVLDGSPAAQLTSPQLGMIPEPAEWMGNPSHEDDPAGADPATADPAADEADPDAAHPAASEADLDEADSDEQWVDAETEAEEGGLDGPVTEPLPEPADGSGTDQPEPAEEPAPAMHPDLLAAIENGDTQLMVPPVPLGAELPPGAAVPPGLFGDTDPDAASEDSMIMAVVCQYGHSSPQNAAVCRVCGTAIAPQRPRLLPRPPLAVLRASNGTTADVDRAVLVGRAPSANRSTARAPRLLTLPSPGHDISRTHVEVVPEGWQVVVTDLRSTNGTVLIQPGSGERQQLPSGESMLVPLGTVLELGDGVSVLIDFPQ